MKRQRLSRQKKKKMWLAAPASLSEDSLSHFKHVRPINPSISVWLEGWEEQSPASEQAVMMMMGAVTDDGVVAGVTPCL